LSREFVPFVRTIFQNLLLFLYNRDESLYLPWMQEKEKSTNQAIGACACRFVLIEYWINTIASLFKPLENP
jgi:hypothetical protein